MAPTLDSPRLRELTRAQLQSLAKREVVRAVGKTEDIIHRLIRKHPRGVPAPGDPDNTSIPSTPPERNLFKNPRKGIAVPKIATGDAQPRGAQVTNAGSPSPSSSTEALDQLLYPGDEPAAGPSNTKPESVPTPHPKVVDAEALSDHPEIEPAAFSGEPSRILPPEYTSQNALGEDKDTRSAAPPPEAPNPGRHADEEEPENANDEYGYPTGAPNRHMIVDALRQFTTLVNTIPSMEARIAESRCLLQRTKTLVEKATPDAREMAVTREYLEVFLLAKMKKKRELWDGTGRMNKQERKLRMEWLRAERKTENEKRWISANEFNARHGLEPEPFSVFASDSDEEVIESLQTTPASSRGGSSKRSREEAMNVRLDGDMYDESQRKRTRS